MSHVPSTSWMLSCFCFESQEKSHSQAIPVVRMNSTNNNLCNVNIRYEICVIYAQSPVVSSPVLCFNVKICNKRIHNIMYRLYYLLMMVVVSSWQLHCCVFLMNVTGTFKVLLFKWQSKFSQSFRSRISAGLVQHVKQKIGQIQKILPQVRKDLAWGRNHHQVGADESESNNNILLWHYDDQYAGV